MSFLTQNFDLRKLANFPFALGMVGRRKLSGPSLNHTFNALSIGVEHTLSFQWPEFGLKCLFKNMFVFSMIFFVAIFTDLEDVALLLMSLYYWHEIDVVITCLDPFNPYLVKLPLRWKGIELAAENSWITCWKFIIYWCVLLLFVQPIIILATRLYNISLKKSSEPKVLETLIILNFNIVIRNGKIVWKHRPSTQKFVCYVGI